MPAAKVFSKTVWMCKVVWAIAGHVCDKNQNSRAGSFNFRFLFWTNWNNEKPRIQRSNLKGFESQDIITKDILTPNGLTIDHFARKLYWSDARLDKIERCDMDGRNRIVSHSVSPRQNIYALKTSQLHEVCLLTHW